MLAKEKWAYYVLNSTTFMKKDRSESEICSISRQNYYYCAHRHPHRQLSQIRVFSTLIGKISLFS